MLGDAWGNEPDAGSGLVDRFVQPYRDRIREFQSTINGLDNAYRQALTVLQSPALSANSRNEIAALVAELEAKKDSIRRTAQAINLASSGANAIGIRMPELSLPQGLGALPFAVPAALVAAVAAAAALVEWGAPWLGRAQGAFKRAEIEAIAAGAPPEEVAKLRQAAIAAAQTPGPIASTVGNVAQIVKWGAIGVLVFLAWRAFRDR